MAFKVTLVLVGFLIVWIVLRQVLAFIEKRMQKVNLIEIQGQLFKITRRALFYALVLLTGTYLIELFNLPLLEKIFHALFVILFARPSKNFLIVIIRYLQSRVAHKTDSKIDDILFDLLIRLRVWIHDARRRMDTISDITDKVKEAFDAEGIEIPYPKRDIYITQKSS